MSAVLIGQEARERVSDWLTQRGRRPADETRRTNQLLVVLCPPLYTVVSLCRQALKLRGRSQVFRIICGNVIDCVLTHKCQPSSHFHILAASSYLQDNFLPSEMAGWLEPALVTRLLLCLVLSLFVLVAGQAGVHKRYFLTGFNLPRFTFKLFRFEYKFSFKPPYLAQKDGSVPFWQYDGNAIASAENVRITPSLRSQKGRIWSKDMTNFDWWEVDLTFRVTGE